jgi:RimK family alpha-L-glutamate ligase
MGIRPDHMRRLAIVARSIKPTDCGLVEAAATLGLDALVLPPEEVDRQIGTGDVALGRLDVLPTLDGPERGLPTLRSLEARGVLVLNSAGALLGAHDKLLTALRLAERGLPHPRTAHVDAAIDPAFGFPVVVKPRFGSWGRDVTLCRSRSALQRCLRDLGRKAWCRRQGALVQELVEPRGYDLRILVAAGEVVGAVKRVAAPGEWRTNIALRRARSRCRARNRPRRGRPSPGRRRWLDRPRAERCGRLHARVQPERPRRLRARRANARELPSRRSRITRRARRWAVHRAAASDGDRVSEKHGREGFMNTNVFAWRPNFAGRCHNSAGKAVGPVELPK